LLKVTDDVSEFKSEDECVVYFTAEWCAPCKQLKPQYGKASVIDPNTNYYMLDVDKVLSEDLKEYNIQSIPQVYLMKKGAIAKVIKSRTADGIILEKESVG
jgi:thioredoxin-like negative regulator of GroEL